MKVRTPADKSIICYCAGGLGNRLLPMASCWAMAKKTGRKFKILWRDDDMRCQVGFNELFGHPKIDLLNDAQMAGLTDCKIYADIKDVYENFYLTRKETLIKLIEKSGIHDRNHVRLDDCEKNIIIYHNTFFQGADRLEALTFFQRLQPVPALQARIENLAQQLDISRSVTGVHARGTDFPVSADQYAQKIGLVLEKNPQQRFLVCSDDQAYEQRLKTLFPHNVIIRPKQDCVRRADSGSPAWTNNTLTSKASVLEAIVDIYLLSRTDFKIYHQGSSFAQLIKILQSGFKPPQQMPADMVQTDADSRPESENHGRRDILVAAAENPARPSNSQGVLSWAGKGDRHPTSGRILYYCPDIDLASAGIQRLYRHVSILQRHGYNATVLHNHPGFRIQGMPGVPVAYLQQASINKTDIVVIPEGHPHIMHHLAQAPCRRFVLALNWDYVFKTLPDGLDWRALNIERVMVVSPIIGHMISWSMRLPYHLLDTGIDGELYFYDPAVKQPMVAYIQRKADCIEPLRRLLAARNPAFEKELAWCALSVLSQADYAAQIRKARVFLSLSQAEGFPTSCLEALQAGTLVVGFDGVGGRDLLQHNTNCLLAPNGDYLSVAYALAPVFSDMLNGRDQTWQRFIQKGLETAAAFSLQAEEDSLIQFWQHVL